MGKNGFVRKTAELGGVPVRTAGYFNKKGIGTDKNN